jgi:hypothetical protein
MNGGFFASTLGLDDITWLSPGFEKSALAGGDIRLIPGVA